MKPFSIVVAMDAEGGIGINGQLPWHLPEDLKEFKRITTAVSTPGKTNAVIMGRKTWDSIPGKFRPLPQRLNIVLSRRILKFSPEVRAAASFTAAFEWVEKDESVESVFVIGGADVFRQAIQSPQCKNIYITHVEQSFGCDVFFPSFHQRFILHKSSPKVSAGPLTYYFAEYTPKS